MCEYKLRIYCVKQVYSVFSLTQLYDLIVTDVNCYPSVNAWVQTALFIGGDQSVILGFSKQLE